MSDNIYAGRLVVHSDPRNSARELDEVITYLPDVGDAVLVEHLGRLRLFEVISVTFDGRAVVRTCERNGEHKIEGQQGEWPIVGCYESVKAGWWGTKKQFFPNTNSKQIAQEQKS